MSNNSEHDVKPDHIKDYLDDTLAIFNAEEENEKTVNHMANQLCLLIEELPEGDASRLINFRFTYEGYKGKKVECQVVGGEEASDPEGSGSDEEDNEGDYSDEDEAP